MQYVIHICVAPVHSSEEHWHACPVYTQGWKKACCLQLGHAQVLSGVRSWQRNAVAGAALQCFCSWMVTFSDAVITRFAGLALSLAAAGCPWLQAEAQHVLQVWHHVTHICVGHAKCQHMTSMSMSMLDHSSRVFNRPVIQPCFSQQSQPFWVSLCILHLHLFCNHHMQLCCSCRPQIPVVSPICGLPITCIVAYFCTHTQRRIFL